MIKIKNFYKIISYRFSFFLTSLCLVSLFTSSRALAHHPWESNLTEFSFLNGIVSGLAHPMIGVDHLLFLLAIGLVGRISLLKWLPSLLLLGLGGSLLSQINPYMNGAELVIGISLIISAFVSIGRLSPFTMMPLIFFHGYVLGQSMFGLETTPLVGYFIGLLISEALVIVLGIALIKRFWEHKKIFTGVLIGAGLIFSYGLIG